MAASLTISATVTTDVSSPAVATDVTTAPTSSASKRDRKRRDKAAAAASSSSTASSTNTAVPVSAAAGGNIVIPSLHAPGSGNIIVTPANMSHYLHGYGANDLPVTIIPVARAHLSRLLYTNPVCMLTSSLPAAAPDLLPAPDQPETPIALPRRNIMTITWLTPTTNHVGGLSHRFPPLNQQSITDLCLCGCIGSFYVFDACDTLFCAYRLCYTSLW
jgi:hypothetical protein